jgi:hypothetical protein
MQLYEVVGTLILNAVLPPFKLRTCTSVAVTAAKTGHRLRFPVLRCSPFRLPGSPRLTRLWLDEKLHLLATELVQLLIPQHSSSSSRTRAVLAV